MSQVEISLEVVLNNTEYKISRVLSFQSEEAEALLPVPQDGGADWAYWNFAEGIASKVVTDELFSECMESNPDSKRLKELGVTKMKAVFSSEVLKRSNSVSFITQQL